MHRISWKKRFFFRIAKRSTRSSPTRSSRCDSGNLPHANKKQARELLVCGKRPKCSLCSCQAAAPEPPDSVQLGSVTQTGPPFHSTVLWGSPSVSSFLDIEIASRVCKTRQHVRDVADYRPLPSMWISCHGIPGLLYHITQSRFRPAPPASCS